MHELIESGLVVITDQVQLWQDVQRPTPAFLYVLCLQLDAFMFYTGCYVKNICLKSRFSFDGVRSTRPDIDSSRGSVLWADPSLPRVVGGPVLRDR